MLGLNCYFRVEGGLCIWSGFARKGIPICAGSWLTMSVLHGVEDKIPARSQQDWAAT